MISVNDLRQGVVFNHDGRVYQVLSFERHKVARAKGVVNVTVRDLESWGVREITFGSNDKVEDIQLQNKTLNFVYHDERRGKLIFSDPQTKARTELPGDILSEGQIGYLVGGAPVIALMGEDDHGKDKIYTVTLPKTIELKVTEAPPSDKGDTASGGSKPVTVETGITIKTPFFIKEGDVIRINTETGQYLERV